MVEVCRRRRELRIGRLSSGVNLRYRRVSRTEVLGRFCGILTIGGGRMALSTSGLYLAVPIAVAGLATLWAVWPEKYVAWIQGMKQTMPPAMQAGADGVQAIFPLSSTKPWYPKVLRVIGILIWVCVLSFAYMFHRF
jgi:hypothetical protein